MEILKTAKLLVTVSRPEFLPANSASLIIGLSWGLTLPAEFVWEVLTPLILAFATITLVAAFAAHINTLSDYELDMKDENKTKLVDAMTQLGSRKLKVSMAIETVLSLVVLSLLAVILSKPVLLLMWLAAVFLSYTYSAPPLRLKSRSFFAVVTLMTVLSIIPVTFVAYVFTNTLDSSFWLFMAGQALTVYAVIVPAEIRDYFVDKAKNVVTMTVSLGLVKASLIGTILLSLGGVLCGIGFTLRLVYSPLPMLEVFLIIMVATYSYILAKYLRLYKLSKRLVICENQEQTREEIVLLATENPKWITIITQTIVLMCLVLIVSKIV